MALFGVIGLLIAFAGAVISVICFLAGHILVKKASSQIIEGLNWGAHVAVFTTAAALTLCCALLVYCFMTGDTSIEYVVKNQSDSVGLEGWLFRLSGLWGGREGSLLFWAWLIAVFDAVVAARNMKRPEKLDNMALCVAQLVLVAFVGVLLFSETNIPFVAMDPSSFDEQGKLTGAASMWGMNSLLEHWAMAIHPPTLFIGYAGLTIPFAYAIAALIVNDPSKKWVEKSTRYTIFSWFFLGIGIGLGAVWAYVVLGWGGYWGWDPVENASLLSWLVGLALIHSFTIYRSKGAFKRWSVMCACLAFAFVVVGTFITRSGIVQSVHAFEGDSVSLVLFLSLIIAAVLSGVIGLAIRWKSFGPASEGEDEIDSMVSRDAAYYLNNVVMIVSAFLLLYLTVAEALPSWLPFGGSSLSVGIYNAIARPLGIVYCLLIAVCPLLAWGKTSARQFLQQAWKPAIPALVLFAILMAYFFTSLVPTYQATIQAGGSAAETLAEYGPSGYYYGLTIAGFLVASLLLFNTLFMIGRRVKTYAKTHELNVFVAFFKTIGVHSSAVGGYFAHIGMAVILVGLIGSSMYVTEKVAYLGYDSEKEQAEEDFYIKDYRLVYQGNKVEALENKADALYQIEFQVYKNDVYIGQVQPSVQVAMATQQQKLNAAVLSLPSEDLFVVYRGVNQEGAFSLDVRVNPLISFVWVGFGLMMIGVLISTIGKRDRRKTLSQGEADAGD